jgi:probable phosphoglycerate mutase
MPETEIWLIRHGETEWNVQHRFQGHSDSPLTASGRLQVEAVGERMRHESFDHFYSSDLLRTRETAEAIVRTTGKSFETDVRIREKHLGIFEGMTVPEIKERYLDIYIDFKTQGARYVIPEGESTQQLQERAVAFMDEMHERHPGARVVCVTHGGTIRALMKHTLGLSLDTPTRFTIGNTSVHQLVRREQFWVVQRMSDTEHLRRLEAEDAFD